MSKILYAASVPIHLENFHVPYIEALVSRGDRVWVLCSGQYRQDGIENSIDLPMKKNMLSPVNLLSAVRAARLMKRERFDLILVHTSLAAFVVRLAVLLAGKRNTRVVNIVHGYLFDKNTNILLRTLLLGAERLLRGVTDRVAVMNRFDLDAAQKHRLGKEVIHIPGMGVDFSRFAAGDRAGFRQALGLKEEDLLLLFPAEFSGRKNQAFLLNSLAKLPDNIYLAMPGRGRCLEKCRKLAEKKSLESRVFFPGQVSDLGNWYAAADICVSSSRYEGLPFNVMEGMQAGKPLVVTRVKGHTDLVTDGVGGFLYGWNDREEFCDCIRVLGGDGELRGIMGEKNRELVQKYDRKRVFAQVFAAMTTEAYPSADGGKQAEQ